MILCHVSVVKAGPLLQFISRTLFNREIKDVPCQRTVVKMTHELGVLSDLQAAEALYTSENTTLAWDATSIGGSHINEVHIHLADK